MKYLGFAASNSSQSINRTLVRHALDVLTDEVDSAAETELLDINDYEMPIYSFDREEAGGIPDLAHQFLAKIGAADALVISIAEHNGSYSAAYKNLFDWCSRVGRDVYQNKPILVMSASPGKGAAERVLDIAVTAAPHFGGDVKASFAVGPYSEKFDAEAGKLTDADLSGQLRAGLKALTGE